MSAKTLDGREIELKGDLVDRWQTRLRGPVFSPGEEGYRASRTLWNAMIDRRPAVIVRCLGTADVVECVRFAREHDLLLCIKGGGHNIAGLAMADGALMLDMSLMRGVWVDPHGRIAHAQAGCEIGDVDRETQLHGLAAVLGFVSTTGIAGLTLGMMMRPAPPAPWLPEDRHGTPVVMVLACHSGTPEAGEKAVAPNVPRTTRPTSSGHAPRGTT